MPELSWLPQIDNWRTRLSEVVTALAAKNSISNRP